MVMNGMCVWFENWCESLANLRGATMMRRRHCFRVGGEGVCCEQLNCVWQDLMDLSTSWKMYILVQSSTVVIRAPVISEIMRGLSPTVSHWW